MDERKLLAGITEFMGTVADRSSRALRRLDNDPLDSEQFDYANQRMFTLHDLELLRVEAWRAVVAVNAFYDRVATWTANMKEGWPIIRDDEDDDGKE